MAEPNLIDDFARQRPLVQFEKRVLIALALIGLAFFLWKSISVWLIFFAGVVIAVILGGFAYQLKSHVRWKYRTCLYLVAFCLLLMMVGLAFLILPMIVEQAARLSEKLPEMMDNVRNTSWGRPLLQNGIPPETGQGLLNRVMGPATRSAEAVTSMLLALVVGLFLAWDPEAYCRGLLSFLPLGYRERGRQVLLACGRALWHWLIAQGFSMLIIGTLVTLGLVIIGAPYAFVLGPLAGLFQFVPNIGPALWAVPALLVTFSAGQEMTLKVLAVYAVIQILEGNFITPLVQRHNVQMPPVLTLLGTILMGTVLGPMGLILGTPLTVVLLVIYRMLYQRDLLHDEETVIPGQGN